MGTVRSYIRFFLAGGTSLNILALSNKFTYIEQFIGQEKLQNKLQRAEIYRRAT